jgi:hypothetical protein
MLVGDWGVGKNALCERISPGFAPCDGYHMYHQNNVVPMQLDESLEPVLSSSLGPRRKDSEPLIQLANLMLRILNPFDNDENVIRMTPLVLMGQDSIGLCYNVAKPETLERAVHKVWPSRFHLFLLKNGRFGPFTETYFDSGFQRYVTINLSSLSS